MAKWYRPNSSEGKITSPFGPRGSISWAPAASTYHLGVDLRAGVAGVSGDIYAASDGSVSRIYKTPLGAWVLEIDHGGGIKTRYAHMPQNGIYVKVGAKVKGGQRVAIAGKSGATTVHLHYETLVNGKHVDPVPFMQARGVDLTVTGSKPTPPTPTPTPTPADLESDMPYIVRNRVAGHASQGTWWIVLPRYGQKPLATPLGKNDTTEGIPAINYTTAAGYNTWATTVATA